MTFEEASIDDLLRSIFNPLIEQRESVVASRGEFKEIIGASLILSNPRARLSRSEARGRLFSCLGELLWYLSGSNKLDFIEHYIPNYGEENSDDGITVYGAYGPRLVRFRDGINQIENIITLLQEKPTSRRAVIQLFDASDIGADRREVPCTCTLQFLLRDKKVHLISNMRSSDAYLGLPHDIFSFTMLQEIVATTLGADIGKYIHNAGSLHLYSRNEESACQFIEEGFQSSIVMDPMPSDDPRPYLEELVQIEQSIRRSGMFKSQISLPNYWLDLAKALHFYKKSTNKASRHTLESLKGEFSSRTYDLYLNKRIDLADEQEVGF